MTKITYDDDDMLHKMEDTLSDEKNLEKSWTGQTFLEKQPAGELYGELALLILATSKEVIDALDDTEHALSLLSFFSSAIIVSCMDSII